MTKIVYDMNMMKIMSTFEALTRAHLKDYFDNGNELIFIVAEGQAGKAIGKNASNVTRISNALKRKIKIVEFSSDMLGFIKNLITPLKARDMKEEDGVVTIIPIDLKTRGYLIGRNAQSLRALEESVKRHYKELKEIKIEQPE